VSVLNTAPFSEMGSVIELVNAFGGKPGYTEAVKDLEDELYQQTS